MTHEEFFAEAKLTLGLARDTTYHDAYAFGSSPRQATALANLVVIGQKTATSSAFALYALAKEALPTALTYDVILDGQDHPVAVVQTDQVTVMPFWGVTAAIARAEGEGPRTLAAWRQEHEAFFRTAYAEAGLPFDLKQVQVVVEHFHVVYPPINERN